MIDKKPERSGKDVFPHFNLYFDRKKGTGKPPPQSNAQMAEGCWANSMTAAGELAEARRRYQELPIGHPDLNIVRGEIARLKLEQVHWKGYADHYRSLARASAPDPRAGRDPGEDDE